MEMNTYLEAGTILVLLGFFALLLWQSIQAQKSLAMKSPMNFDEDWHQRRNTLNQTRHNRSKTQNVHAKYSVRKLRKSIRTKSA